MFSALPAPITQVDVPHHFSPSALDPEGACRLRLVLASLPRAPAVPRLPVGPAAIVGTLLHQVLACQVREPGIAGAALFERERRRLLEQLQADPARRHLVEVVAMRAQEQWRRFADTLATRAAQTHATTRSMPWPRQPSHTPAVSPVGAEKRLESHALRLRGRADRIRRTAPGRFEVWDYKTGRASNDQGELEASVVLQLQAYGLMLAEQVPTAVIRLLVHDGECREVAFDRPARRAARSAIGRIVAAMPAAGPTPAETLAQPGRSCWGCPVRHVCTAYLQAAPTFWLHYPPHVTWLPTDTWGQVQQGVGLEAGAVRLVDAAGRQTRVTGLDHRHGPLTALSGRQAYMFGLEATGATRGFDGKRFHPYFFHERPRHGIERRAWSPGIFVAPTQ